MKDLYEVLEIESTATEAEIKTQYRKLAKKYHPDLNPGDAEAEARFKEISAAYEVLGNAEKRKQYDTYGESMFQNGGTGAAGYGGFSEDIFSDIFDIFGGGFGGFSSGAAQSKRPMYGEDVRYNLTIDLEDVLNGTQREIEIERVEECSHCHGSGAKDKDSKKTCTTCSGRGSVRRERRTAFGVFVQTEVCPDCHGAGEIITEECPHCHGNGTEKKKKKILVKVPKGVREDSVISIRGEGSVGKNGGPNGDLNVYVDIRENNKFKRSGDDLYTSVSINYLQAVLGDQIEVDTLDGKVKLTIPEGTQSHTKFKIAGKGLYPLHKNYRCDLYVVVKVDVPKNLNDEQKESLLKHFKDMNFDYEPKKKNIFEKIKEKF